MSDSVDMWRLRIARGNSSAGGGDWTLYDNRAALEHALFTHAVEAEAHADIRNRATDERRRRWFKTWWKANTADVDEDVNAWHTQRIVGVDHLVDGAWVEVEWSISPPVLTIIEPEHSGSTGGPSPEHRPSAYEDYIGPALDAVSGGHP